jgi:uncharacterized membrane protein YccC
MISLSTRAKESIKTGLAMAIAYGIALQMDWDRPYWAAFAVAFISLPTVGHSLNKGALRMVGTLVGGAAALTFLAWFPQQRWWFMVVLSLYIGFCTYMMAGKKYPYFWMVSAFVCAIICFDAIGSFRNPFQTAVTRVLETGMGILVYSLVAVFLWPRSTRRELDEASRALLATQRQLYETYRNLMAGAGTAEDSLPVRMQEVRQLVRLGQALDAAEMDTYEVWEVRHAWQRFHRQSTALRETLGQWRESLREIQQLDVGALLPNLEAVFSELELRFEQIERMLAREAPDRTPQVIRLAIDTAELRTLPHFQKAAVAVTKTHLENLEALARSLFDCVRDIRGYGSRTSALAPEKTYGTGLFLDPDRVAAAVRVTAGMWLAFLIWVYIDPPGHSGLVSFAVALGLGFALAPQLAVYTTFPAVALSCAWAGVLYIFVMPHLSGFAELSAMIFGSTFAIAYLFWEPRQALARAFGLAFFAVLTSIVNQQSYSFSSYANSTAMVFLVVSLLVVTSYIPTSPRPEKAFVRLMSRFFRRAEFLVSHLSLGKAEKGLLERGKTTYSLNDLRVLPEKIAAWSQQIDYRTLPGSSPEQVQALVTSLRAIAYRLPELGEARAHEQAALIVRELSADVHAWRVVIQQGFSRWSENLGAQAASELRERLAARLSDLEARVQETFDRTDEGELNSKDYENFYRLLGSYRGVSEATIAHAELAQGIAWAPWQEARF